MFEKKGEKRIVSADRQRMGETFLPILMVLINLQMKLLSLVTPLREDQKR